ncbi:L-aspartate oxidase [Chryseolinea sp. H1M3-3]|uniref:L-aspartate oxidase n=1 Tax=Chryseolinea sp. H1M3-3 TaxID=3034144 RepID=UPI0023EDD4FE|nr:L-aspartate oxidase [Chryseolinea sp. H1M3-3]
MENQDYETDILIVGAGIAGLSVAIKLSTRFPEKNITLISKDRPGESNTRYAQGGIATVINAVDDSFEQHIQDTLDAGGGLCRREVVEAVVREAPERLAEVIAWGTDFDRDDAGKLVLGLEGGHSAHRIVHVKDETGFAIVHSLLRKLDGLPNVQVLWRTLAVDLLTENSEEGRVCNGITYVNKLDNHLRIMQASFTVLATGGIGQAYALTTNPSIATGDGIAMAHRAGASIDNMAFVQFHPTLLNVRMDDVAFLISEALRGFGARLVSNNNRRFMFDYDVRGELAPRDIVARAIYLESQNHPIYLDCRHLPSNSLKRQFPKIYQTCLSLGIDITREKIPVTPAAHYLCGGIVTNMKSQTDIKNLYAIGECACTGLHGANRLASNSLIEALVFAHRCYMDISERMSHQKSPLRIVQRKYGSHLPDESQLRNIRQAMKVIMVNSAGIVRSFASMREGLEKLKEFHCQVEEMLEVSTPNWLLYEIRNLLTVGMLILQQALDLNENRGSHHNCDLEENPISLTN